MSGSKPSMTKEQISWLSALVKASTSVAEGVEMGLQAAASALASTNSPQSGSAPAQAAPPTGAGDQKPAGGGHKSKAAAVVDFSDEPTDIAVPQHTSMHLGEPTR